MQIPVGTTHHASVTASGWKPEMCDHCDTLYAYPMSRVGMASQNAPLFVGMGEAGERAADAAGVEARRRLEWESEAVWCPGCGRYRASMYGEARALRFDRFSTLASAVVLLGMLVLTCPALMDGFWLVGGGWVVVAWAVYRVRALDWVVLLLGILPLAIAAPVMEHRGWQNGEPLLSTGALLATAGLALHAGRWLVNRLWDPNAHASARAGRRLPGVEIITREQWRALTQALRE